MSVDDVLLLVMLDNTDTGKRVFNLLSECRTVIDEHSGTDRLLRSARAALLDRIDGVLGPVGDMRSGGLRELLKVEE